VPTSLELVVTSGSIAGQRFPIPSEGRIRMGRSGKGINVPDPLVSMDHSSIEWDAEEERYLISDLGSQTGTLVNGEKIEGPTKIHPGSEIQIGETYFLVEESQNLPRWIIPSFALSAFIMVAIAGVTWFSGTPITYNPRVSWSKDVHQGGDLVSPIIKISPSFIRAHGIDHRGFVLRRVTDHDQDGVDELWITLSDSRQVVYTFGAEGSWTLLGDLPAKCVERQSADFPDLKCQGQEYRFNNGKYGLFSHEGAVMYMPPTPELPAAGPVPYRVSFSQQQKLAGWLDDRGVTEPIHYLICEGALPGIAAQVLTESGKQIRLNTGCIRQLVLSGPKRGEFGRTQPVAVAFTGAGHTALIKDFATWFAGSPEGMFLDREQRGIVAALETPVKPMLGSVKLSFQNNTAEASEVIDRPSVARERRIPGYRPLLPSKFGKAAPVGNSAVIKSSGVASIDPEGCSMLEVETFKWHCAAKHGCTGGTNFMTVKELGCDAPKTLVSVPYKAGLSGGASEDIEVRVNLIGLGGTAQFDVLKAVIEYRVPFKAEEEEAPEPTE